MQLYLSFLHWIILLAKVHSARVRSLMKRKNIVILSFDHFKVSKILVLPNILPFMYATWKILVAEIVFVVLVNFRSVGTENQKFGIFNNC